MKHILWIIMATVLISTAGYCTDAITPTSRLKPGQSYEQYAQAQSTDEEAVPMTAGEQATVERAEFVDRLTALQDWDSELDKQYIQLNQDYSSMQSQLKQNKYERQRIKIDQRDAKRNIKELQREKRIFDKKEKTRMKMEKMRSGN